MRALIISRVSTTRQETEHQVRECRDYCKRKKYSMVGEIRGEGVSSKISAFRRPEIKAALERGDYDVLIAWSVDRLSRNGVSELFSLMEAFKNKGVKIEFVKDSLLNVDNENIRDFMFSIFALLARIERQKISERTIAGLVTARSRGKVLGRPAAGIDASTMRRIEQLRQKGRSWSEIAKAVRVPASTCWKYFNISGGKNGTIHRKL